MKPKDIKAFLSDLQKLCQKHHMTFSGTMLHYWNKKTQEMSLLQLHQGSSSICRISPFIYGEQVTYQPPLTGKREES